MNIITKNNVLPIEQLELWKKFNCISKDFILYGGTALALRYGHRTSVDFDFFTFNRKFDLNRVREFSIFHEYEYKAETIFYNTEIEKIIFLEKENNLLELLQKSAKELDLEKVYKKKIKAYEAFYAR